MANVLNNNSLQESILVRMSYTNRGFDAEDNGESIERIARNNQRDKNLPKICVIGSGDFGRALAGRLANSGYEVTIASRNIARNR